MASREEIEEQLRAVFGYVSSCVKEYGFCDVNEALRMVSFIDALTAAEEERDRLAEDRRELMEHFEEALLIKEETQGNSDSFYRSMSLWVIDVRTTLNKIKAREAGDV